MWFLSGEVFSGCESPKLQAPCCEFFESESWAPDCHPQDSRNQQGLTALITDLLCSFCAFCSGCGPGHLQLGRIFVVLPCQAWAKPVDCHCQVCRSGTCSKILATAYMKPKPFCFLHIISNIAWQAWTQRKTNTTTTNQPLLKV